RERSGTPRSARAAPRFLAGPELPARLSRRVGPGGPRGPRRGRDSRRGAPGGGGSRGRGCRGFCGGLLFFAPGLFPSPPFPFRLSADFSASSPCPPGLVPLLRSPSGPALPGAPARGCAFLALLPPPRERWLEMWGPYPPLPPSALPPPLAGLEATGGGVARVV